MKISRSQIDLIIKIVVAAVGVTLIALAMVKVLTPNINNYPALDSCFETSVHKVMLCNQNPNYLTLDKISEQLVRAVIMSEDDKFFDHKGVDWIEIKNSLKKNIQQRSFARGGSTLTQQLVKNAYLHQGKSLTRKFKEYFLAQAIEARYSKALILEKYLNLIELGQDLYGVKRAAQYYFKKPAADLEMLESLYLVTLLPNPKRISKSFVDQKLSPWQIKKIKSLLQNFQRRGQIDPDERIRYENALALFPWTDGMMDSLNIDQIEDGVEFEVETAADTDAELSEFPNFRATPATPEEDVRFGSEGEPENYRNNSPPEETNDINHRFGSYEDAPDDDADSSGQNYDQRDRNQEAAQQPDADFEENSSEYDGTDEDDLGYDAEGF